MTRRIAAILVAVVVGLANSLCACADSSTSVFPRESDAEPTAKSHCHSEAPAESGANGCHTGGDSPSHDEHGSCGHCTGTVSADVAQAKVTVPTPPQATLLFFVAVLPDLLDLDGQLARQRFDHTGLSPPAPPTTLLSLFCSLLN